MKVPLFDLRVTDGHLREELLEAADKVFKHGRIVFGPEVQQFEEEVARYIGTRYAVGVASGTSALYLALRSIGVGEGDEVITTPFTWIATVHAISACGAIPLCVDIGEDLTIDPAAIEAAMTSRTKAIVPMHYAGKMCDMDKICAIAKSNNLFIVEDAAQAYGSEYKSKKAGSFSKAGAFSMNPLKALAGYGEAGVIVTDDCEVYERIIMLRHSGIKLDPNKIVSNDAHWVSLNHKIDTLQAALLLVAMRHLPEGMAIKNKIALRYREGLKDIVQCPEVSTGDCQAYFTYPIQTDNRDALKEYLQEKQVETRILQIPLACDAPVYAGIKKSKTPMAHRAMQRVLITNDADLTPFLSIHTFCLMPNPGHLHC